jgi:hypothetical protein
MFALRSLWHGNPKKVQKGVSMLLFEDSSLITDYWLALFGLVLPLISITPLAFFYVFYILTAAAKRWSHRHLPGWAHALLSIYAAAEALTFLTLWCVWLRKRRPVSGAPKPQQHLKLCETIMKVMSIRSEEEELGHMSDGDDAEEEAARFRRKFTGWFFKRPYERIPRDNVSDWLAWSAFNKHIGHLVDEETAVIKSLLVHLEERAQQSFRPGYDKRVKSIRLTLDAVPFVPRPLLFYLVVGVLSMHARWALKRLGYTLIKREVQDYRFEYFHRPASPSCNRTPLLFLHGLGMGVAQYLRFIHALEKRFPGREVLLLAQGQISMLPIHRHWLRPPSSTATVRLFEEMASLHHVEERGGWTVLSHSFGSIPHSWLLKQSPRLAGQAAAHVMVDPICFRLWESDVCYNFLYRRPRNAMQLIMSYFVGKELGISYTLHRAFFWYDNLLLPEDLRLGGADGRTGDSMRDLVVYIGGRDEIINARAIKGYLEHADGVQVHYYHDHAHGKLLNAGHMGGRGLKDILAALDQKR